MIVPLVSAEAISDNNTEGTPLATPAPIPEIKRPMNNVYKLPEHDNAAPTIKKLLLNSKVSLFPYFWDGLLQARQPIQAPKIVNDVARDAST